MIVEIAGKRRRIADWQTYKRIGVRADAPEAFVLTYRRRQQPDAGEWAIPVAHGGKLAASFSRTRTVTWNGTPIRYRAVSWRELPETFRAAALQAIQHVQQHGDPIDNDESIFATTTEDA